MTDDNYQLNTDLLEANGRYLHALARSLVHDEHLAADLVQEAAIRAQTKPPAKVGALGAWLGRVVRNLALDSRREAWRRRSREERAARPNALPDTAAVVAHQEMLSQVLAAVKELPEPYRSTIHHRFYDDLTPTEIAERLGVPRETVKARLRRGLIRLRESLDRSHGGERAAWCTALVSWLKVRHGSISAVSVPSVMGLTGVVLLMKTKFAIFSALCLILLAGLAIWEPWGESGGVEISFKPAPPPIVAQADPHSNHSVERIGAAVNTTPKRKAMGGNKGPRGVLVQVSWDGVDQVAPGVQIRLVNIYSSVPGKPDPEAIKKLEVTDTKGEAHFSDLPTGTYRIACLRGAASGEMIEHQKTMLTRVTFKLALATVASGRAVDGNGKGIPGASIFLGSSDNHRPAVCLVGETDRDGRFTVYGVKKEMLLYARKRGYQTSRMVFPGSGIKLVLTANPGSLAATVRTDLGAPLAGAVLEITSGDQPTHLSDGRSVPAMAVHFGITDSDGRCRIHGLGAASFNLIVQATGYAPLQGRVEVGPGEELIRDYQLVKGGTIQGKVTGPAGKPIYGAPVSWISKSRNPVVEFTDWEGSYKLVGIPPGPVVLRVECPAGEKQKSIKVANREVRHFDFHFSASHTLRGVLQLPDGRPASGFNLVLEPQGLLGVGPLARCNTDKRGSFCFDDCPAGTYTIKVYSRMPLFPLAVKAGLSLTDFPLTINLPHSYARPGKVAGRVVDHEGRPRGAELCITHTEHPEFLVQVKAGDDGRFRFDSLPSAKYHLHVDLPGHRQYHLATWNSLPGKLHDFGRLLVGESGGVSIILASPGEFALELRNLTRANVLTELITGGKSSLLTGLQPGRYQVYLHGMCAPLFSTLEISPGKTTSLWLSPDQGVRRSLVFTGAPNSVTREYQLRVVDSLERVIYERSCIFAAQATPSWDLWLGRGEFTINLATRQGHQARATVKVIFDDNKAPITIPFSK